MEDLPTLFYSVDYAADGYTVYRKSHIGFVDCRDLQSKRGEGFLVFVLTFLPDVNYYTEAQAFPELVTVPN